MVTCSGYDVIKVIVPADATQHTVSVDEQCSTADRNPATPAPAVPSNTYMYLAFYNREICQQECTAALYCVSIN